jgi:NAD(P)-dependent dehydrogenase (short-subunit alcohol dehydrogenase family)
MDSLCNMKIRREAEMTDQPAKVALVTGAARGIGLATAKRFLADGWAVACLDVEDALLASSLAAINLPDRTLGLHADVSQPDQIEKAIAAIKTRFGRLDALVNNAGIAIFKSILETTLDDWNRIMAVNLTGPFLMVQATAPLMRDTGGGAVVNIASISALRASTMRVAYGTSKAGVAHLTKQQAVELASIGIRVNAVCPGPVDTAMAKAVHTPAIRKDYHDTIPLNRYGLEEELAEVIVFLCGPRASYMTGQVISVDGGFEATGIGLPTLRLEQNGS